ncbi:MAG: DUF4325 domain-containing protein [Minicystis sp.]
MAKVTARAAEIDAFIFDQIVLHPSDIARVTAEHFGISRQAVNRYLTRLVDEKMLSAEGSTRSRKYMPVLQVNEAFTLPLSSSLEEHRVWMERVEPLLQGLPENVSAICTYGFTEMLNNAIDHSGGTAVAIRVARSVALIRLSILDDGVGIFRKIAKELHLDDERHAIFELSKGKLTTDASRHSGEGIFFTSQMFDTFMLASGDIELHRIKSESWLLDRKEPWLDMDQTSFEGTFVMMTISPRSKQTSKAVFDRFSAPLDEDYGFTRTLVPVALSRQGTENLISRSQAKRLLARFDRFKEVLLDFKGVPTIGQAFADEVFRVFANLHPDIHLTWNNATPEVESMIRRALSAAKTAASS